MVVVPVIVVESEVAFPKVELPSTVKFPEVSIFPVVASVVPETVRDPSTVKASPTLTSSLKSPSSAQTFNHLKELEPSE